MQVLGFPRLQTLVVLTLELLALGWPARRQPLLGGGLGLAAQAFFLWPYLPFTPKDVPDAHPDATERLRRLVINC